MTRPIIPGSYLKWGFILVLVDMPWMDYMEVIDEMDPDYVMDGKAG